MCFLLFFLCRRRSSHALCICSIPKLIDWLETIKLPQQEKSKVCRFSRSFWCLNVFLCVCVCVCAFFLVWFKSEFKLILNGEFFQSKFYKYFLEKLSLFNNNNDVLRSKLIKITRDVHIEHKHINYGQSIFVIFLYCYKVQSTCIRQIILGTYNKNDWHEFEKKQHTP